MDFFTVGIREGKKGEPPEIFPDFTVGRSKDLMVRGRAFYAIWDEETGLWSTDEYDVQRLVDEKLRRFAEEESAKGNEYRVKYLKSFGSNGWSMFRKFVQNISDNAHPLDENLTFANTETKKTDYVSKRLPYPLAPGDCPAWNEIVGTLYEPEERAKIEWQIGAIVAGDSKKIQKFGVFYGPPGSGKGTILEIIMRLFPGYYTTFEAKALGSSGAAFATEVFKDNPLVAIQGDGDLSKIEDNARLNSIISHEDMTMNEKYKPSYTSRVNAYLFMGTNQPVKISDAKSGLIRRLIDIHPSGKLFTPNHYHTLMGQIDFELGAIAHQCLEVYRSMGKNFYNGYRPLEMMLQTDVFFNFVEAHYDIFKEQDGTSLKHAYDLYKKYCEETGIERPLAQYKVREELRNYFNEFKERATLADGSQVRSYYDGFNGSKFKAPTQEPDAPFSLVLEETTSLFDLEYAEQPAQLSRENEYGKEVPAKTWVNVKTTLAEIDTSQVHFVKIPEQHIVIDFDIRDPDTGEKSLELNLKAASEWPHTYAELSQGGNGVHLHYNYEGDVTELAPVYDEGIEVKTLLGNSSLRRRLTKCNAVPVATMGVGPLPVKEKKKVIGNNQLQGEKHLRALIRKALNKDGFAGTKSAIDFIQHILDEAYSLGFVYDVEDLRSPIFAFANGSSNQAMECLRTVMKMKFKSADISDGVIEPAAPVAHPALFQSDYKDEGKIAFYDVEVYPNLFVVCWKYQGSPTINKMINPSPQDIEGLIRLKLVGFNNRRYDNHILYARYMGYGLEKLYTLSQNIINGSVSSMFGEAYNLSYADIYDFSSKKQGLKKFMIELGLHKMEMDIPWDQPVPENLWPKVVEYCCNDVIGTEKTFEARKADFVARQILAELSGLTVNDTTQRHTARIIFGNDRNPQSKFVYTDLSTIFPGYEFNEFAPAGTPKSSYRGEDPSEGGYVYSNPGMYMDPVVILDVASMHPSSIIALNAFGEYTPRFKDLLDARLAIKHKDFSAAKKMLDGRLAPYLEDESQAKQLSYALKIVINIVYGLTSAKFDNPFRDPRNKDNIVAKRGALFMIELKNQCAERGMEVVHIKTDSIKLVDPSEEDVAFVHEFGRKYGYDFEHEATYDRFCLVNDAVYIARYGWCEDETKIGNWEAVGAQFQHPVVFKTLFSKENINWDDQCETKQVMKGSMYLDFDSVDGATQNGMQFVGRIGRFVPVTHETGGGILYVVRDDKSHHVAGTKGFFWMDAEIAKKLGREVEVDSSYFDGLTGAAYKALEKYGDVEAFLA